MAKQGSPSAPKASSQGEVDDEIAVKPVNPMIDHGELSCKLRNSAINHVLCDWCSLGYTITRCDLGVIRRRAMAMRQHCACLDVPI